MTTYIFASLRGQDFEIEGSSPIDAWNNLCEREKDEGTLWRCFDEYRNKTAVDQFGFSYLGIVESSSVAYRVKSDDDFL